MTEHILIRISDGARFHVEGTNISGDRSVHRVYLTNLGNGLTHSFGRLALEGANGYGHGFRAEGFVPHRRIVWTKSPDWRDLWIGTVNGNKVFKCEYDASGTRPWFVGNVHGIPHSQGTGHPTQADAEASAEAALTAFVTSLGASFPAGS